MADWTAGKGSGGADGSVGQPGKTMSMLSFDEKTRPITRKDLFNFMKDEKNLTEKEKEILSNAMMYGISGSVVGFLGGWTFSGLLPWRWLEKRSIAPFKGFAKFGRFCFGVTGLSLPFLWVQQWVVGEIMQLDEKQSVLAFHVKRLLITQRTSLLFSRSQVREVTKEEQAKLGMQNVTIRQQESRAIGGTGKSIDVDLAMQQQVLTPVAQTGYKSNPK